MTAQEAVKFRALQDNLFVLPHYEAEALAHGLPANAYALLSGPNAILVDAVFADIVPGLQTLISKGCRPVALVLTHRHVAAQADLLPEIARTFHIPVFLHPIDAAHPQAKQTGFPYSDPAGASLFADLGIEIRLFPGHTEGHVALYTKQAGGLLIAGDCAVGPTIAEAADRWTLVRPPVFLNVDDDELRQAWEGLSLPVSAIVTYHGVPRTDVPERIPEALQSLRRKQATATLGETVIKPKTRLNFRALHDR